MFRRWHSTLLCSRALATLIGFSIVSWAQYTVSDNGRLVAPLRPLLEALNTSKISGSLVFAGHCDVDTPPDFPPFHVSSSTAGSPLEVAREMFRDAPAIQVTQDSDGTIRITERGVPTELLNVMISHISFEAKGVPLQSAAFSANAAARHAILESPEVVAFMKAHGIERRKAEGLVGSNTPYSNNLPHISKSMNHLTLSQALDSVLRTFPGIWVYEYCQRGADKGHLVDVFFFDLQHPGFFENLQKKVQ